MFLYFVATRSTDEALLNLQRKMLDLRRKIFVHRAYHLTPLDTGPGHATSYPCTYFRDTMQ